VPAFGAKQDAIPGFLRDLWFKPEVTGTFRSQCVELCGKEHGFMPIVVRVVSHEDYTKWVGEQQKARLAQQDDPNKKWDVKELVARGEKVYASNCVACHQAQGQGTPAMKAPALAGNKLATGKEEGPIDTVLNGRPNTAMQPFGKQLSDTEIAAVITYVRNSWGNKASDVQPAEVKARRK
jgi:cytochrome c oxidase subunit 2